MKLSARNQLKGTIVDIQKGAVNGIVVLDIGGGNKISSTISMNAIEELGLEVRCDQSDFCNGRRRFVMFVQLQKGGVFTDSLFDCSAYACVAAVACCLPGAWRLAPGGAKCVQFRELGQSGHVF